MQEKSKIDIFISSTHYTDPVDIKKIKFIFSAIDRYTILHNKNFESLRILEVACGPGGITFPLTSLGCEVRAFDINEDAIQQAKNRINQNKIKNLTVTLDNGYTFDDRMTYDIIIASEVFEHTLEPLKLAANITKRMVKGSYLLVTVPNGYGLYELKNRFGPVSILKRSNWLRYLFGKSPYVKGTGKDHCYYFTKKKLVKLFSNFSLRLITFAKSDSFLTIFLPLRKNPLIANIDLKLADILPYWLASGWYFVFEMERDNNLSIRSKDVA